MATGTPPSTEISHCIGDISLGFTSTIAKRYHPESTLSTKMCGVKVLERKMEVSLTFSAEVDQSFSALVTGSTKQTLLITIGVTTHATTFTMGGLIWPKYVAEAKADELIGDTVTAVVDKPTFTYSTA